MNPHTKFYANRPKNKRVMVIFYIFLELFLNLLPPTEPHICRIITEGDEAVWDDEENAWSLK